MAWAHDGRLSVVVHGESSPSALEWSWFLNDNRSLRDLRVLVCTYGGSPDGKQRRELLQDPFYGGVPTVIMTNSAIARGIVTVLNLFNSNMKALPLDADAMAHGFLGLDVSEAAHARELRERLERGLGLGRFAGLAAGDPLRKPPPEGGHVKIEVFWGELERVMLILTHDVVLGTAEAVGEFKEAIIPTLRARKQKMPLVVCIDGMTIRPSAAQLYGDAAKEIVSYATAFARYGKAGTVQMVIAAEAMRNHQLANLFDTRAAAVAFVLAAAKNDSR